MLPEEQESCQRRIIQENNPNLSDNIQAACVKRQEEKNKQNYNDLESLSKVY